MLNDDKKEQCKRAHPMVMFVSCFSLMLMPAMAWVLIFNGVPQENKDVIYLIAGQIMGAFATVLSYWLGSSRGSFEKMNDKKKELKK